MYKRAAVFAGLFLASGCQVFEELDMGVGIVDDPDADIVPEYLCSHIEVTNSIRVGVKENGSGVTDTGDSRPAKVTIWQVDYEVYDSADHTVQYTGSWSAPDGIRYSASEGMDILFAPGADPSTLVSPYYHATFTVYTDADGIGGATIGGTYHLEQGSGEGLCGESYAYELVNTERDPIPGVPGSGETLDILQ